MFRGDAAGLDGLLNGLIMRPNVHMRGFQIGKGCLVLLGQDSGKIPGNHHIDIVFFGAEGGNEVEMGGFKMLLRIIFHQHFNGETNGVGMVGAEPLQNLRIKLLLLVAEDFWRDHVAGGPVVDIGQEFVECVYGVFKVFHPFDEKAVNIIFFVTGMGKRAEKYGSFRGVGKIFGKSAQLRRAHTEDGVGIYRGNELAVKFFVNGVSKSLKAVFQHNCFLSIDGV